MKFMEKLLVGEKVEWKKLGEVCEIIKGKQFNKEDMLEIASYPVINGGIFPSGYVEIYNQESNTITISQGGASAGYVNFIENRFWLGAHAYAVIPENETLNRYVYHFLKMEQNKLQDKKEGAGIPSISKSSIEILKVPIPSLKIQEKIVKILDNFTKYVTELQTELQARNKQYNYYRDMLLSEDYFNKISEKIYEIEENGTLALVPIKEVCIRQRGFSITASEMKEIHKDNAPIKIFAGGKTTANIDEYNIDKKYIIKKPSIIVKSRGNIDFEFYDNPFSHKNELWSYSSNDDNVLNIRYLYYYLKKNIKYFKDKAISGKLPQISTGITDNYKIWLPSIIIQNKIVKILDRFQELLSDTKGLLPLEIEQRRKQYEYYREKLLTFDKEEGYALSTAQHSTAQHSTATNNE